MKCDNTWDRHVKIKPVFKGQWAHDLKLTVMLQVAKNWPHTHPTIQTQMYESDLLARVKGESKFWIQSSVIVGLNPVRVDPVGCVWERSRFLTACQPSLRPSQALPPLRHDLSLYSSRAASAERAARLFRPSLRTLHHLPPSLHPLPKSNKDKTNCCCDWQFVTVLTILKTGGLCFCFSVCMFAGYLKAWTDFS